MFPLKLHYARCNSTHCQKAVAGPHLWATQVDIITYLAVVFYSDCPEKGTGKLLTLASVILLSLPLYSDLSTTQVDQLGSLNIS